MDVAPCGVPGVTVATAPSADYFETLDQLLGATRSATLDAWLPYAVALTNRASQNIVAVAVRWVVTNDKGQSASFVITPSMFDQPRQHVIPGKSVIVIPVALLGGARLPREFQLTPPADLGPRHLAELAQFQSARNIQATLDGVVFASGQFAGPNGHKEYEEWLAETTAPSHTASTVLAMKASGEAIGTVVAWLDQNARNQPQGNDWNGQFAARTARALVQAYRRGGEALLYEAAQGYAQAPGIHLYR